ncbi:hypothetical protein AAFC00_003609 [Neodothiora populina]|uniref:WD40 repeat-like protein n=1 Tax=Neodothiora populina TaxID=2781224 RepID=A0ABR3PEU3_9PEZI
MSSFFTKPASLKRKRNDGLGAPRPAARRQANKQDDNGSRPQKRREARDDDSVSSGSSDDEAAGLEDEAGSSSSESEADEDAAGKRTRLAERYLQNTRAEILAEGFDAKDIDAELLAERMGERLKEDTAESKGKIHRWIANDYDWRSAEHTQFRSDTLATTGVACCPPFVYTVSKDMILTKWELPPKQETSTSKSQQRVKPKRVAFAKGNGKKSDDWDYKYHTGAILCVAASMDGKFVATGGEDKKLIVWDAETLKPLKVFTHHRDSVTSLAFRRYTNQLYSASKDRTIKTWSLDELAYVETLFGHQDEVVDVAALNEEKCVTVGARDRTARYWRIVEESQLVFRGGGNTNSASARRKRGEDGSTTEIKSYNEGCIDRVAMVDEETFVTGSDNGTISLWNIQKKKAVFNLPLAHGLDPPPRPEDVSAEADPENDVSVFREEQPRWITALETIPFTNIMISGSWDGQVRAWKISEDKRRIEPLGPVGCKMQKVTKFTDNDDGEVIGAEADETLLESPTVRGVINDLAVFERGDRGQDGISIVAAIGKEHRLGRWYNLPGKNYSMLFKISKQAVNGTLENGHTE